MKKYKIKVLVWLLSLSFLNIHAQQGFMKSYVFGNFHGGGVIYNDDAYMIIGGTGFGNCPDNSATCMDVLQTDLDGNLNWQQRFNYPNEQFFPELNGIKILNDSTYIIAGNSTYLETSWQNFFLQINHNGDSLQLIEYGNEFRDKGGSLGIIDKKLFAFSYEQEIDIGSHLKLLKTNTNFSIPITAIPLPDIADCQYNFSQDMAVSLDSTYFYIGAACADIISNEQYIRGQIRKIDTLGNTQWAYNLSGNLEYTNPQMRVKTMKNGNVVAKWFDGEYSLDTQHQAYLLCLSSEGYSLWRYDFKDNGYTKFPIDIAIAENGDIIGCGYAFNPNYNYEVGWLFRVSAEGELLWEKEYVANNVMHNFLVPESITEDEDCNIITTGATVVSGENLFSSAGFLMKVLPNGCFTPDCSGNAEDTLIVKSWTGLFEPNRPNVEPLLLMPNPASCRASVLVPLSLSHRKGIFHIYDTAGRLVKTVAHANDSSMTTFSVAELSNGVYLLQYLSNEKQVSSTKLIVQH